MISRGNNMHTVSQKFRNNLICYPKAAGCVLAIGNDKINLIPVNNSREQGLRRHPANFANYVTNKKQLHIQALKVRKGWRRIFIRHLTVKPFEV